ncbi:unnamed protein product [Effrenium voratum]|uniref:Uncharacterized protein n=1 Tax=Effrenium voratum TaxID=2562239 RepID=A0AA36ND21_9DINO|nr:unnamed protein product [Effrenium voratum]
MNFVPLIVCSLAPWGLFVLVYSLMAFQIHYTQPVFCYIAVFMLLFLVLCIGAKAATGRFRIFSGVAAEREPSWLIFFALSLLLAWIVGFVQGDKNFQLTGRYYDLGNLNNYTMVYPNRMLGQQLLDAGIVQFAPGSQLDIQKSMGFKNGQMYCVAPIVFGSAAPMSYDFWAVGTDCCSGSQADFSCRNYNNPQASGGIRLMYSQDRAFYRLAVQQAEATYNIKASHPLFFRWEVEPSKKVLSWLVEGHSTCAAWILSYLVFQRLGTAPGLAHFCALMAYLKAGDQENALEMLRQQVRTKLFNKVTASLAAQLGYKDPEAGRKEDALRWSFYSGDYVVLRGTETLATAYAVLNPPQESDSPQVEEGQLLVAQELRSELLGGAERATLELVELEEATSVVFSGLQDDASRRLHAFFGTLAGQDRITLQDLAEEEDLDLDEEALEHWQGYVEKARCAMCPVWRGLTLRFEGPTLRLASTDPASASPASGRGLPGTLVVEAILGPSGPLPAAIVGTHTRLQALTAAAPAA